MLFTDEFLDSIRARVPVSQVCGSTVKLTKRGNEFVGLSPFNPEKTPSFTVNDEKGFYHCFSSGNSGDIFRFLVDTQGYHFHDAVEHLAQVAGVSMPVEDSYNHAQEQSRRERKKELGGAVAEAAALYNTSLINTEDRLLIKLLTDRGLTPELIRQFQLGYAPAGRRWLTDKMLGRGYTLDTLLQAGLTVKQENSVSSVEVRDRLLNRLVFPIHNQNGVVVGFGGRRIGSGSAPKYLNSGETELFHKRENLYNYHRARLALAKGRDVVVVEGYMDVLAMQRAGISASVAPLGTAVTDEHLALLWRLSDEPVMCFDGDQAGMAAAVRLSNSVLSKLRPGKSLRFAVLPAGTDPDDMVQDNQVEQLRTIVTNTTNLCDFLWNAEISRSRLNTPERIAHFEQRIDSLWQQIADISVQKAYRNLLRDRLRNYLWQLRRGGGADGARTSGTDNHTHASGLGANFGAETTNADHKAPVVGTQPAHLREAAIVLGMIYVPHRLINAVEALASLHFTVEYLSALRDAAVWQVTEKSEQSAEQLVADLKAAGFGDSLLRAETTVSKRLYPFVFSSESTDSPQDSVQGLGKESDDFGMLNDDADQLDPDAKYNELIAMQRKLVEGAEDLKYERQDFLKSSTDTQWLRVVETAQDSMFDDTDDSL